MVIASVELAAERVYRQIPKEGALVCVVGLISSGKTELVEALGRQGMKTFDPVDALAAGGEVSLANPRSGDAMVQLVKGEFNRTRPHTLVIDGLPRNNDQLLALKTLARMYTEEFIIVHVKATLPTRLSRYAAGLGLGERIKRGRLLKSEEEATKVFYSQLDKFIAWNIPVMSG